MHFLEYRHFFYCLLFTFLIFLFKTFETFLTSVKPMMNKNDIVTMACVDIGGCS